MTSDTEMNASGELSGDFQQDLGGVAYQAQRSVFCALLCAATVGSAMSSDVVQSSGQSPVVQILSMMAFKAPAAVSPAALMASAGRCLLLLPFRLSAV